MAYALGIDIGTTYTAAAIFNEGRAETFPLGAVANAIPSVVYVEDDGTLLCGEPAAARGLSRPQKLLPEFKRRFGDETPLRVGQSRHTPTELTGALLNHCVHKVSLGLQGPAEHLTVTHPATWSEYHLDLMRQATSEVGIETVGFLSEPDAAAIFYASQNRVETGSIFAVYDFGGGTFDATILQKTQDGFRVLGEPHGDDQCGGIDFDQSLFAHVSAQLGNHYTSLDDTASGVAQGKRALVLAVVQAKELLSTTLDAAVPVNLPGLSTEIRVTRNEFESLIGPTLERTFLTLDDAINSANLNADQLDSILLIGGSSRIPAVGALLQARYQRPIAVDAHPKFAVCLGASITAAAVSGTGLDQRPQTVEAKVESSLSAIPMHAGQLSAEEDNEADQIARIVTNAPLHEVDPGDDALASTVDFDDAEAVSVDVDIGEQGLSGVEDSSTLLAVNTQFKSNWPPTRSNPEPKRPRTELVDESSTRVSEMEEVSPPSSSRYVALVAVAAVLVVVIVLAILGGDASGLTLSIGR